MESKSVNYLSQDKYNAFEYVVFELIKWYMQRHNISDYDTFNDVNSLSKLKIIKLHFFVSAINSQRNSLLKVFDNFYAMPYGHVESDIYDNIGDLRFYQIDKEKTIINQPNEISVDSFKNFIEDEVRQDIEEAVNKLREVNEDLIMYNGMQLVEVSHLWSSWRSIYDFATQNNKYSSSIPSDLILEEAKTFYLP